jgi:citrate synthase
LWIVESTLINDRASANVWRNQNTEEVMDSRIHEGLDGIVVTATHLSHVDGEHGRLVVAGHNVEKLAASADFETACALLWSAAGCETSPAQAREQLSAGRARAFELMPKLGDAFARADGMDALRAALAHLPADSSAADVVGAAAVYTAAFARARAGLPVLPPSPGSSHARDLLAMLGAHADSTRARALAAYLVTVLDHGLNASTFAARVVASTRSDLVSAVVAGIGALKGPLHGGAPGPVLDMLDAIAEPAQARAFLERELAAGRRIMGMGHRIYRQRDPRAFVLERAVTDLERSLQGAASSGEAQLRARLELARSVERSAEQLLAERYPERSLKANVEFYTAVLLSALSIDASLFSPLFACARSAGWTAHFAEQQRTGRLIRPSAKYVGNMPAAV